MFLSLMAFQKHGLVVFVSQTFSQEVIGYRTSQYTIDRVSHPVSTHYCRQAESTAVSTPEVHLSALI